MCEKAVEIQELWKPQKGDWGYEESVYNHPIEQQILHCVKDTMEKQGLIWLPRQDQLQEMVNNPKYKFSLQGGVFERLWKYYESIEFVDCFMINSYEQLWLAFAMQEKFDKQWNGKEWK